jgi:hypothetical protein
LRARVDSGTKGTLRRPDQVEPHTMVLPYATG